MLGAHQDHIKLSFFWLGGGRKKEEYGPCPQDFCSFCVYCIRLSLHCTFTAHFLAEGGYTTVLHLLCACAGSQRKSGLFSMQFKHCLKRRHGLDNNFSNKFNTLICSG